MQIYVEGPDQLEAQWNKNSCLCVYLRNKPQMSHECSITNDPTHTTAAEPFCKAGWAADLPRMPRTPHQYLWVWWSLTGFQSWPPPSSWRDCTILKKKSVPFSMDAVTHPRLSLGLTSWVMKSLNPPLILVALNLPLSHEAAAENHWMSEWMHANTWENVVICAILIFCLYVY